MRETRGIVAAAIGVMIVMLAATPRAARAVEQGQVDTFEDGSLLGWQNGGLSNPNPATNVASGGPGGANDNYMQVTSNGAIGAGGKLVVFNIDQWAGDFLEADIDAVQMQVNCFSVTPPQGEPAELTLRLVLVNAPAGQTLSTVADVVVPAGSGWTTVSFSLAESNLTGGTYATVMGNVTEFNLVHSPIPITSRQLSPNIEAQIGVDNITALPVPEPTFAGLAGAGLVAAVMRRGQRRGRRRRAAA
jgi:hypothetical protein